MGGAASSSGTDEQAISRSGRQDRTAWTDQLGEEPPAYATTRSDRGRAHRQSAGDRPRRSISFREALPGRGSLGWPAEDTPSDSEGRTRWPPRRARRRAPARRPARRSQLDRRGAGRDEGACRGAQAGRRQEARPRRPTEAQAASTRSPRWPETDRVLAERIHAIVTQTAPGPGREDLVRDARLRAATARSSVLLQACGEVQGALRHARVRGRRRTWTTAACGPTSYGVTKLTKADEQHIADLVRRATS